MIKRNENVTSFLLVRHAHAVWTPDEQRPLSPAGLAQAQRVADVLAAEPVDVIYSSPALRAMQTVLPLAARHRLPLFVQPDLRECVLSPDFRPDFERDMAAAWRHPAKVFPGGESNAAGQRRIVALVERLYRQHPGRHVVLGTHGNLLALLLQHFDASVDFAFWQGLTMPDVYRLRRGADGKGTFARLWKAPAPGEQDA